MTGPVNTLVVMMLHFAVLSFFAMGGANVVVPEMHRHAVDVAGWMSDRQFADLFAIAQAAPGPNAIIVTLIGFHVLGLVGGLLATLAFIGPSCVLAYYVGRVWDRFREARWRIVIQAGVVPVGVGLTASSALILSRAADHNAFAVAITVVTAALVLTTRLHPLWMFACAGIAGYLGFV